MNFTAPKNGKYKISLNGVERDATPEECEALDKAAPIGVCNPDELETAQRNESMALAKIAELETYLESYQDHLSLFEEVIRIPFKQMEDALKANSIPRADVDELLKTLKAYSIKQHHGFQARTAIEIFNKKHGVTK